jgi:hypothetical protein
LEEKHLIILLIIALSIIVLLVIVVVVHAIKKPEEETKYAPLKVVDPEKAVTIEQLIDIAANRKSSKNDLSNAVVKVSQSFPFPKKAKGELTREGKIYLNFILLVASHKQADAKLVAFMNTELKKKNPEYTKEIDIYENEGLRQRGKRI